MMYDITNYSKTQAKKLGVTINPSKNDKKKIDVFKDDVLVASIGAKGYGDYPTFVNEKGVGYANERRRLYKQRHEKDRKKEGTAGYYADKILW